MTQYCDDGDAATRILNDLADRLMAASNVPQRNDVSIVIVNTEMPNAFAMPDDTIVVTNSLIAMAEQPDEIAGMAVLLASQAGAFLTGQTIIIDGGVMAA